MTTSNLTRTAATAAIAALLLAACSTSEETAEAPPEATRATSPIDWNLPAGERYHRTGGPLSRGAFWRRRD